jgi:hypothetical protein
MHPVLPPSPWFQKNPFLSENERKSCRNCRKSSQKFQKHKRFLGGGLFLFSLNSLFVDGPSTEKFLKEALR